MTEVLIGRRDAEHVLIRVLGRMHPGSEDFWDGNWLDTPVEVVAGGFSGRVDAGLRADELRAFRSALELIYDRLAGEARLHSIETRLEMRVVMGHTGHLDVEGTLSDIPGDTGNRLTFVLRDLDQSDLPPLIAGLRRAEAAFPVLGRPPQRHAAVEAPDDSEAALEAGSEQAHEEADG